MQADLPQVQAAVIAAATLIQQSRKEQISRTPRLLSSSAFRMTIPEAGSAS